MRPIRTMIEFKQIIERLLGDLSALVIDEDELRKTWSNPETQVRFLKQLEEKGFGVDECADDARQSMLPSHKGEMRNFLESVLSAYERSGVEELSLESLPALLNVKYGGLADAKSRLGELGDIRNAFVGIQADIYRE